MPDKKLPPANLPFVPPDDTGNMRAIRAHHRLKAARVLDTNNQILSPLVLSVGPEGFVEYVDLGIRSAKDFWDMVVLPNYEQFKKEPSPASAINATSVAWHLHEWIWIEQS